MNRALSLTQPWASLLACGIKSIECRSWTPKFVLPFKFYIHATSKTDEFAFEDLSLEARGALPFGIDDSSLTINSAIVGFATLSEVKTYRIDDAFKADELLHFATGYFKPEEFAKGRAHGFVLTDPHVIMPVPCKGALSFWKVPQDVMERVWF